MQIRRRNTSRRAASLWAPNLTISTSERASVDSFRPWTSGIMRGRYFSMWVPTSPLANDVWFCREMAQVWAIGESPKGRGDVLFKVHDGRSCRGRTNPVRKGKAVISVFWFNSANSLRGREGNKPSKALDNAHFYARCRCLSDGFCLDTPECVARANIFIIYFYLKTKLIHIYKILRLFRVFGHKFEKYS